MARLPRVYIEGILYYVTSKGGHSQNIFTDTLDYEEYLTLLSKYKDQYGFQLFSYALMPTRLSMLIELKNNIGISNIMHDINSLYTKIFNGRHNKKGHLFQERFKAVLAEKESYLLQLTRHIHLAPKAEGLVNDPKKYPYSSHAKFVDPSKRGRPEMSAEIEEIFNTLKAREAAFDKYVTDPDKKELSGFRKKLQKNRILGSKAFSENVKKAMEEAAKQQKRPPALKRKHIIYMITSGMTVLVLAVTIVSFYRQNTSLKSTYDVTLMGYEKTLDMLRQERDKAVKANKDAEDYAWKIRLTEQAVEELKREREEALRLVKEIEGYQWEVKLSQTGGPKLNYNPTDVLIIEGNQIASRNLMSVGFYRSKYSKRVDKNGVVTWETMQNDGKGGKTTWRGEWDGEAMKGVMRRRWADGTIRDFSFVSVGKRVKR